MGRTYWFDCSKCGYRATVSGKLDRGRDFYVRTIVCNDCRALYDAVVRWRVVQEKNQGLANALTGWRLKAPARRRAPTFEGALSRLPLKAGVDGRLKWVSFKVHCPKSPAHKVELWEPSGKCPRCGTVLDRAALAYRIWE